MAQTIITKVGCFAQDVANQINAMFLEVYALIAAITATNPVGAPAAGYKVARGTHTQVAQEDAITVAGMTSIVSVQVSFHDAPTIKQMFVAGLADIGGNFLIRTYKPTATGNVTPIAATDFTDNIKFDWIVVGT